MHKEQHTEEDAKTQERLRELEKDLEVWKAEKDSLEGKAKYTDKRGTGEIALILDELEECIAGKNDVEDFYMTKGE